VRTRRLVLIVARRLRIIGPISTLTASAGRKRATQRRRGWRGPVSLGQQPSDRAIARQAEPAQSSVADVFSSTNASCGTRSRATQRIRSAASKAVLAHQLIGMRLPWHLRARLVALHHATPQSVSPTAPSDVVRNTALIFVPVIWQRSQCYVIVRNRRVRLASAPRPHKGDTADHGNPPSLAIELIVASYAELFLPYAAAL
jgi:hypothetical protein